MRLLTIFLFLSQVVSGQIIFRETFENAAYFPTASGAINQVHSKENCNPEVNSNGSVASVDNATYDYGWTLTRVTSPVYSGSKAGKFEVRDCGFPADSALLVGGSQRVRSEVVIIKPQDDSWWPGGGTENDVWYSYRVLFPSVGMEDDPISPESIIQWFEDGGADCLIEMMNGRLYFQCIQPSTLTELKYDLFGAINAGTTNSRATASTSFVHMPLDTWTEFVFHFIHSQGTDGLVEIWRNGTKIQTISGRNMHTSILPKWKVGLYKWDYTEHVGRSVRATRIMYMDDLRFGGPSTTLTDMRDGTPPANVAPTVVVSADVIITLPTTSTSVTAVGNDMDGTIVGYAWSKVSGPSTYTINSPTSATTTLSNLVEGTYVFRNTVTDDDGATDTDDLTVMVRPVPNVAPTANAGSDQSITLPTSSVTLNGSLSSDSDGSLVAYTWTKISGTGGTISSPFTASTSVTGLTAGSYTYRLTVTDNSGATATDNVVINVQAAPSVNVPPTANAGSNITLTLPASTTTLSGVNSTDIDGFIQSYNWVKESGGVGATISNPNLAVTTVTALQEGIYSFRLTVTDNDGATGTTVVQVTVNKAAAQTGEVIKTKKPYKVSNMRNGVFY